jgi:putative membrane protein
MDEKAKGRITAQSDSASISTELASRRTGMSFQRTRMSADRTLMSVIRTSLSLIGFGFTLFQIFQKLHESNVLKSGTAPLHFGLSLVVLGVTMLVVGIGYHVTYMYGLRRERAQLKADGLIHAENQFPLSLTLTVAMLLLGIGVLAIVSMVFGAGPYG